MKHRPALLKNDFVERCFIGAIVIGVIALIGIGAYVFLAR